MKCKVNLLSVGLVLLGAALLGMLSFSLRNVQDTNAERDRAEILSRLLPSSGEFNEESYSGEDSAIRRVFKGDTGYIIETTAEGYVDEIRILVGVKNDGSVSGLTVLSLAETAGLGQRALRDTEFLAQFLHTKGNVAVGDNIDALTGATVTSKALAKAVNAASAYVTGADISSTATEWSE